MNEQRPSFDPRSYRVTLRPLDESDGGGYAAFCPQFGDSVFGQGETPEAALNVLYDNLRAIGEWEAEEGRPAPPPEHYAEPQASGHFSVRLPKTVHANLIRLAEAEGVSLNQYVSTILARAELQPLPATEGVRYETAPAPRQSLSRGLRPSLAKPS